MQARSSIRRRDDTADISGGVTFSLENSGDFGAFTIDANTGQVTLTADPNFEGKPSYSFTVVATDAAGHHDEQHVDARGQQPRRGGAGHHVGRASPLRSTRTSRLARWSTRRTATDLGDISGGVTYSLKDEGDVAAFTIDPDDRRR